MKKVAIILTGLVVLLASCTQQAYLFTSFREPANEGLRLLYSEDGYHWTDFGKTFLVPQVGSKVMRDPSLTQDKKGGFHLVWTCGWQGDKGFGYAFSKDLIHWSEQKMIPVMQHEDSVVNVWAPEWFYDKEQDEYLIIWASAIPYRFPKGEEEERNNHRLYYTTTRDFKSFTQAQLFFDPGFSVIDAVLIRRGKGDYVQVFKDNTRPNRNIKVAFAPTATGPYTNISQPFTENFTEGPSVVKVKNEWLIYFDSYRKKTYEAVRTKDFTSFMDISKEIKIPEGHKHGTIVPVKKKVIKKIKASLK